MFAFKVFLVGVVLLFVSRFFFPVWITHRISNTKDPSLVYAIFGLTFATLFIITSIAAVTAILTLI